MSAGTVNSGGIVYLTLDDIVTRPRWHMYSACTGRTSLMYSADKLDQISRSPCRCAVAVGYVSSAWLKRCRKSAQVRRAGTTGYGAG